LAQSSIYTTMQLIADILSFKNNQDILSKQFTQTSIDWDAVVIIGSKHLMLPALFCRLKEKGLLPRIPKELHIYLEEIARINRGRNEILLQEAHDISEIFNKEQIDHVFIKGVALIASDAFKDLTERMIGDIDILVAPHQLHQAFDLLEQNGYVENIRSKFKKQHRHLSRQINPNKIGAVELHSEVLTHKFKQLIDINVLLKNKQKGISINVPSSEDFIRIAILTTQINDKGHFYGYINLKTIYDCLVLGLQGNIKLLPALSEQKHTQSFLAVSKTFFPELRPSRTNWYSNLLSWYYKFKITQPNAGQKIQSVIYLINAVKYRLHLLICNKNYRKHVMQNKLIYRKE
jgi:hypothetical protein